MALTPKQRKIVAAAVERVRQAKDDASRGMDPTTYAAFLEELEAEAEAAREEEE